MPTSHADSAEDYSHDAQLGRILDEFLRRRSAGETITQEQLCAQYPELADDLREMLSTAHDLRPSEDRIAALIKQGVLDPSDDARYLASLGAYKITGFIGRGGMGIVLKAYEESLNRTVALKLLRPELTEDDVALSRFEREAKVAAALNHANIVTVYAVGRQGDMPFIAMEHIEGRSLSHLIRADGPLPTDTVRHIFRQLLQALGAAHQEGLLHRDVKSSNILLENRSASSAVATAKDVAADDARATESKPLSSSESVPSLKLADFGLARMRNAQTRLTLGDSVLGTPEYMSPEQARGDEDIDDRADLYSAGVVLCEMLTGRTPFRADTQSAVIHQILNAAPVDPRILDESVDPVLASLALRLMAKKPGDRFASASAALGIFESNHRVYSPERRRRVRRHLAAGFATVGLLLVASWLVSQLFLRPPRISATRVDPELSYRVQVRYGDETEWKNFYEFDESRTGTLTAAKLVDVDGKGRKFVVVGSNEALDREGNVLVAFDCSGTEQWQLALHSEQQWPDCGEPRAYWDVARAVVGDLDDISGEELVVVGQDPSEYPTRISVVDPRDGTIRSTFWHFGHIKELRLLRKCVDGHRPAILAWGYNNVLDGFKDGLREGERRLAHWDTVQVIMILDPNDMNGLGPLCPHASRNLDISAARICAYAFLDWPYLPGIAYVPQGHPTRGPTSDAGLTPEQAGGIEAIQDALYNADEGSSEPWFQISTRAKTAEGYPIGPVTVDRNLRPRRYLPAHPPGHVIPETQKFWEQYWRVIIRDGEPAGIYAGE